MGSDPAALPDSFSAHTAQRSSVHRPLRGSIAGLVDATRARGAIKRGGEAQAVESLDPDKIAGSYRADDLLAIDDALTRLAEVDARRARVVELRVFGALTMEETAEILGLSPQSVRRDWELAKAWLLGELSSEGSRG
ncbi:MAG: hypothetical protein JOZ10_12645 [Acidobacteria bacterium]|nr:hypothetical protein [Acidobacteriota bacterium]